MQKRVKNIFPIEFVLCSLNTHAMYLFTENDKLNTLVDENYNLLPVFNRFGIRPGFKDKTVAEVCAENNIDRNFFLALINTYNNPEYFPETKLLSFSPDLIVNYLIKTHEYYEFYFLPRIEQLIDRLISGSSAKSQDLKMIKNFYEKFKQEFLDHIHDEEKYVFPILTTATSVSATAKSHSIAEVEHGAMEVELNDLKSLLIKYFSPEYNDNDFNELVAALYQFEKDMVDHSRIEDKILMARLKALSKSR